MTRYLFIILSCLIVIPASGQTPKIDSLKRHINSANTDKARLQAIMKLLDEHESLPKDTLWDYALKAKALASKLNDPQNKSFAIIAQANAYLRWNNADSAKALIEPEIAKYKVEDAATRDVYFRLLQVRIDCTDENYFWKDAFAQVYSIMRQAEKYKDSVILAESMNTLGAWNYDMDFLPLGRQWDYKALAITSDDPKFYRVRMAIYFNLGDNYTWINKLDSATWYINKAIKLSTREDNLYFQSIAMSRLASMYNHKKDYEKAEQAILTSLELIKRVDGDEPQQDKLLLLASIYRNSGNTDKAIKVLNDGLIADSSYKYHSPHSKKTTDSKDLQLIFYYELLAKCYHDKGDSKNYEATLEKIIAGKDAFYKANSADAIAEIETRYEFQKKEATIAEQRLALTKKNYLFYSTLLFLVLAGIIAWLIFREYSRKQKLKQQQLQEEEKRLSMQAIADAGETERKRIAADLHDNLGAQLSFIKRNVNFIMDQPDSLSQEDERKYLGYVNDIAQNAMIDLRETIWVLNKDEVGIQEFADKLKSYTRQQLISKEDIKWSFQEDITCEWKLTSGEVMHLFRIVQEVISNIIKHSGAGRVNISLQSNEAGTYQLVIADDGKGFDMKGKYDGHYGLENIQSRAKEVSARLNITSDAGHGTKISLVKEKNNTYELYDNEHSASNFIK